jgi:hypothetical protein
MLVGVFVCGVYLVLDQAVTIMYLQEDYSDSEADLKTLSIIIEKGNLSKYQIVECLEDHRLRSFMDVSSDTISLERVILTFEADSLLKVEL